MAENEKAPVTVALQNGGGTPYSLHHDLAGHFRMDRAVVGYVPALVNVYENFSSVSITNAHTSLRHFLFPFWV
jgi:hypothetical protein